MTDVAGIDGTRFGWVVVRRRLTGLEAFAAETVLEALNWTADCAAVAIDMPIGLPDAAEPGGRECEWLARKELGERGPSVFSSPCRAALGTNDHPTASALNRASSPHAIGLSKQSVALFGKMREVDAAVTPEAQSRVFEVHPELCFTALARVVEWREKIRPKSSFLGLVQRLDLLKRVNLDVAPLLERCAELKAKEDDVIDATVAAWTAARRATGEALRYPAAPPRDARGLFMEMWA